MIGISDEHKNRSMQSTMYKSSFIQSQREPFGEDDDLKNMRESYSYAHIPLKKQLPRWNQSSSTWRHTSHRYSFSKDSRFRVKKPYYLDIIEPQLPSTLSPVTCTFGKGTRKPISSVILRNAKEKPAPDRYDLEGVDQQTRKPSKGKSFGIGWGKYEKVYSDVRKDVYSGHFNEDNPPACYQVRQVPGKDKKKFTAYGRLKMFTSKMADITKDVPGPHHKIKDRHLYGMIGLNDRNFSFGQRIDLTKPANDYPGSKYYIPGFCDKFENLNKRKSQNQNQ